MKNAKEVGNLKNIMVLAGTKDAREVIEELVQKGFGVLATVTTAYGRELLEPSGARIRQGRLDTGEMVDLIVENDVRCIVDASHPFAKEASVNAILAGNETGVAYLRFERSPAVVEENGVRRVKTFEAAADEADRVKGNILLTTGSNHIELFAQRITGYKTRLYARVLPDSKMVEKCERAGLSPGNIIAMKGPFSEELNMEMLKYCNAAALVAKESGSAGGTPEKLRAAFKLGIPAILVDRPCVDYGNEVRTVPEVIRFVEELF